MVNNRDLKAGVAEIDMNPPLGLATGDGKVRTTGYLTPICVRALVLSLQRAGGSCCRDPGSPGD